MSSGLALARRIATLPPWLMTIALVVPNLVQGPLAAWPGTTPLIYGLQWLFIVIETGWMWGIYRTAIAVAPRPAWTVWIFVLPPLLSGVATILSLPMNNTPMAFAFLAALLFCIGQTAAAIESADSGDKPASALKGVGTALLLFFSIVGVWWLRQRLVRIAGRT